MRPERAIDAWALALLRGAADDFELRADAMLPMLPFPSNPIPYVIVSVVGTEVFVGSNLHPSLWSKVLQLAIHKADSGEPAVIDLALAPNYCARCGAAWHEGDKTCWRGCSQ